MNRSFILGFILICIAPMVFSVGVAMPPEKIFNAHIGQEFYIDLIIINQEGTTGNYLISFEGSLADRAKAVPSELTINPPKDVIHRGKPEEDGFGKVRVYVNSTGFTPGTYDLGITTTVSRDGGALNIVQKVTRKIEINYAYPPSFLNKAMNFIFITFKKIFKWIITELELFYNANLWLNYLFFAITLAIVFYIGVKVNNIIKYFRIKRKQLHKEKKKLEKHGFFKWIFKKVKDTFKKVKKDRLVGDKEKKDERNKEDLDGSGT